MILDVLQTSTLLTIPTQFFEAIGSMFEGNRPEQ